MCGCGCSITWAYKTFEDFCLKKEDTVQKEEKGQGKQQGENFKPNNNQSIMYLSEIYSANFLALFQFEVDSK